MTLASPAGRVVSKVAALVILLGGLWLGVSLFVVPLVTRLFEAREQIGQERILLGRLLDEAPTLTSQSRAPDTEANETIFLPTGSDAEKLAALQARIEQIAAETGVQLKSLQPTGDETQGPLQIVGIRAVANGPIEKLQAFLYGLEAGRPTLIVASLDVAPPAQERDANGELDMRLSISGAVPRSDGVRP